MRDMLNDMDFEQHLEKLGNNQPELIKFLARQQFTCSQILLSHGKRITCIERQNKKMFGFVGGIAAIIGAVFTGTIDYIIKH